ncbi:PdxA family dehydrogenase [Candidatus Avelusimicrobium sp.]|uniref:PdxA family dehydrogenase n=1 Tax=Candidatus Avelusimicrobium sp. TaxID=3048833 RepID=UPI003F809CD4
MKPIVLITAGDPLGIGPEVTVKSLKNPLVQRVCFPVVIGEPTSLVRAGFSDKLARLIAIDSSVPLPDKPVPSFAGGETSFKAVELGIKLALKTKPPLVTAPINKQSWSLYGVPYTGHTELLREYAGKEGLMMFISGDLRCGLVTEHFAVADLPHLLTQERIVAAGVHFNRALKKLGIQNPHIAVCALNPHASDNGKFGTEENEVIAPAVKALHRHKIKAVGPLPADALWLAHASGQYDGLLCMYHDQALLGLKLAAKKPIVHITAGLKFLRVSPTHGTAFDIAEQNIANPSSMTDAILFAATRHLPPQIF